LHTLEFNLIVDTPLDVVDIHGMGKIEGVMLAAWHGMFSHEHACSLQKCRVCPKGHAMKGECLFKNPMQVVVPPVHCLGNL
jgi:hypothetical protein